MTSSWPKVGLKVTGGEIGTKSCISDSSPIQHEILENFLKLNPFLILVIWYSELVFYYTFFLTMSQICRFLGNKTDIVFYILYLWYLIKEQNYECMRVKIWLTKQGTFFYKQRYTSWSKLEFWQTAKEDNITYNYTDSYHNTQWRTTFQTLVWPRSVWVYELGRESFGFFHPLCWMAVIFHAEITSCSHLGPG